MLILFKHTELYKSRDKTELASSEASSRYDDPLPSGKPFMMFVPPKSKFINIMLSCTLVCTTVLEISKYTNERAIIIGSYASNDLNLRILVLHLVPMNCM